MKKIFIVNVVLVIMIYTTNIFSASVCSVVDSPGTYNYGSIAANPTDENDSIICITVSNVVIDLSDGVYEQVATNTVLNFTGITINPNLTNITIKNGTIRDVTGVGVSVREGCSNITLDNVKVLNGLFGIVCAGTSAAPITDCLVENCQSFSCNQGSPSQTGFSMIFQSCQRLVMNNCTINNNNSQCGTFFPIFIQACNNCSFDNITVRDNSAVNGIAGISFFSNFDSIIANSFALNNIITSTTSGTFSYGFYISTASQRDAIINCYSSYNNGGSTAAGFITDGSQQDILFQDCTSLLNTGTTFAVGFFINSSKTTLNHCLAKDNTSDPILGTSTGFILNFVDSTRLIGCTADDQTGNTAVGFEILTCTNCAIEECKARSNVGSTSAKSFGFRINGGVGSDTGNNIYVKNIALNNGTTASNQMNNFISGAFNNISYSFLSTVTTPFINLGIVS